MNPAKVNRDNVKSLLDLPNVGPATKADLYLLGIHKSEQLVGLDAYEMHERLCQLTKIKHDPCVIDIFLSLVCFANGGPAKPWWEFTNARKQTLASSANQARKSNS